MDGLVVGHAAWQAALDRLAQLADWADAVGLSKRVDAVHEAHVEDITRLLALSAQIGDASLQLDGLQERYVNIRLRAMPKRKRERMEYEVALRALEARLGHSSAQQPVGASA